MNQAFGKKIFAALVVVLFAGTLFVVRDCPLDSVMAASIPIILCAGALVLGMMYMTIFHSELHEHEYVESSETSLKCPEKINVSPARPRAA